MIIQAIRREAWRDVSTGTSRSLLVWLLYVTLVGLLVAFELLTVIGIIDRAEEYQAAGANTHIMMAPGRIDGAACEAISRDHNVRSGALRRVDDKLKVSVMQSVPLDQWIATSGIAGILGAVDPSGEPLSRAGMLVSEQVTDVLGPGLFPLETNRGEATIAGVFPYPDDGRMTGLGFSAILPETVQSEPYDECWVQSWPEHPDTLSLLNEVVLPAVGTDAQAPQLTQLNTTLGVSFDGAAQFQDRMSRLSPILAFLVGVVLGYFVVRSRKLELASARHAGVTMFAQLGVQLLQQGVWIFCGSMLLLSGGWTIALGHPDSTDTLLGLAVRIIAIGAIGAVCGVVIAVCVIRERALFAYFQNRS